MVVAFLMMFGLAPSAWAASDGPCPVELDLRITGSDSALLTARKSAWSWCPTWSATVVDVRVDGVSVSSTPVKAEPVRVPIAARPGAVISAIGRVTLGSSLLSTSFASIRIDPLQPPERPRGLHVWGATSTSLAVGWSAPSNAALTGPLTYWVTAGGRMFPVTTTEVVIDDLYPGLEQVIMVTAQGAMGDSPPAVVVARTDPPGDLLLAESGTDAQVRDLLPDEGVPHRNNDGSANLDGNPATMRQDLDGIWNRDDDIESGEPTRVVRVEARTSMGARTSVSIEEASPSVANVDADARTGIVTARLHPGARTGSVIVTVSAPAVTIGDVRYEAVSVSRRIVVEAPDLGAIPTPVNGQTTDAVT